MGVRRSVNVYAVRTSSIIDAGVSGIEHEEDRSKR